MCDQTDGGYVDGDVVWVKFSSVWWPGVVKDVEPEVYAGLKNKPIAAVQFFEEDQYEFVKNLDNIYHYNSKRKDEFLKKGLDKWRAGAKHMLKFRDDVVKAEKLVNGNADIINDPKYAPEKKTDYKSIFGNPSPPKKERKEEEIKLKTKILPLKKRKTALMRASGNGGSPRVATHPPGQYSCPFCNFSSNLVGAMSSHVKFNHTRNRVDYGANSPAKPVIQPRPSKTPTSSKKRARTSKGKSVNTPNESLDDIDDDEPLKKSSITLSTPEKSMVKNKKYTDALIADWSDEDDDSLVVSTMKETVAPPTTTDENPPTPDQKENSEGTKPIISTPAVTKTSGRSSAKQQIASCFDFDDEDDGFIGMSNANTYGRKIPRVIPTKDKTDLGMDLEIDDLFKRKPESSEDEGSDEEQTPIKKKRGRPPKSPQKPKVAPTPVKKVKPMDESKNDKKAKKTIESPRETLASTRTRRVSSRKSYVNGEIRSIEDSEQPEKEAESQIPIIKKQKIVKKKIPKVVKDKSDEESDEEKHMEAKPGPISVREIEDELIQQLEDDPNEQEVQEKDVIQNDSVNISHQHELVEEYPSVAAPVPVKNDDAEPSKPSRRKQDLKKSSLVELDDLKLDVPPKKEEESVRPKLLESGKPKLVRVFNKKPAPAPQSDQLDLEAQVESLLAETAVPVVPKPLPQSAIVKQIDEDFMADTIEYLEDDESTPPKPVTHVKTLMSPVKKWREDLKEKLVCNDGEPTVVKKSVIPQWKQGIQEQLKANLDPPAPKESISVPHEPPVTSQPTKVSMQTIGQKKYIFVQQQRPKILGKPQVHGQNVMIVGKSPQRLKVLSTKPTTSGVVKSASPQLIQIKSGSNKLIQLNSSSASPQKIMLSSSGMRVANVAMRDGKTFILRKNSGGATGPTLMVRKKVDITAAGSQPRKCVVKRDGNGKFEIKQIMKSVRVVPSSNKMYTVPNQAQRTIVMSRREPVPVPIQEPEPELLPVEEEPVVTEVAPPVVSQQQVVAMPVAVNQDGQTNYMLVHMDDAGNFQPLDSAMLAAYNMQSLQSETPTEMFTPTDDTDAPARQDILATALEDVLEPELPLIIPADDTSKPLMPLDASTLLISPNETVSLQKPIMTVQEMPSPVVADAAELLPPPLPPTPEEDALLEDEGGLMIAEQPVEEGEVTPGDVTDQSQHGESTDTGFTLEEPQQESENTFESMPLLNEECASEEPIGDQSFQAQTIETETSEYLPTSTNPDLEPDEPEETGRESSDEKDGAVQISMPYVTDDGFIVPSQETEVTSTTEETIVNIAV